MKSTFAIICLLFTIPFSALAKTKIDTTDSWYIYYNKKMVTQGGEGQKLPDINIKQRPVKVNDFITVIYRDDAPCDDCKTKIYIQQGAGVVLVEGKGAFNKLQIPVSKILKIWKNGGKHYLNFYYLDTSHNREIFKLTFVD